MSSYADPEVIEAGPSVEIERYEPPQHPAPLNLLGSSDPEEALSKAEAVAIALDKRVRKRKLFTKMGLKDHLHVEAWTMLGSLLGVFPVIAWTRPLTDEEGKLLGWEARAEAHTIQGALVGAAESECRFAEPRWKAKPSTELRGMAQTRAISRALRAPLGFVAELAGYAATPEPEMPPQGPESASNGTITDAQHRQIGVLVKELEELLPTQEGQKSYVQEIRDMFGVRSRKDLTKEQASEAIEWLKQQKEAASIPL